MADRIVAAGEDDRTPDWRVWRWIREPQLCQLVALSLSIDPHKVKTNDDSWYGTPLIFYESQEFQNRLYVLRAYAGRDGVLWDPRSCMSFRTFIALVHRFGWEVPPEMRAMADKQAAPEADTPTLAEGHANVEQRAHDKLKTLTRNKEWQEDINKLAQDSPGKTHSDYCRMLSKRIDVNFDTIRRNTKIGHS